MESLPLNPKNFDDAFHFFELLISGDNLSLVGFGERRGKAVGVRHFSGRFELCGDFRNLAVDRNYFNGQGFYG